MLLKLIFLLLDLTIFKMCFNQLKGFVTEYFMIFLQH